MAIFDFIKTKGKSDTDAAAPKTPRPECDITKTQVMVDMFRVPGEQRDDSWHEAFYANVPTASFACADPQVVNGPDGFPYFVLKTPEAGQPFESFCIRNMKDDFLLERGFGVVINPRAGGADWVFSYGDIVNLHLNNEFYTAAPVVNLEKTETIREEEQVLVAQPSESYLPGSTRQVLRSFLQSIGVKDPGIMMVCRTTAEGALQELAFNIFPDDFPSPDHFNYRLQQISWFLPRHYIVIAFSRDAALANNFAPL